MGDDGMIVSKFSCVDCGKISARVHGQARAWVSNMRCGWCGGCVVRASPEDQERESVGRFLELRTVVISSTITPPAPD